MTEVNLGDRVQLTGRFLHATGQIVGGEGHVTWIVVVCDCR